MKQPLAHIGLTTAALPLGFAVAATLLCKPDIRTGALITAIALILPVPQLLQLATTGIDLGIIARAPGTALGVTVATVLIHAFQ